MCKHITIIHRCKYCKGKIVTEELSCKAPWYKRIGRQACDNTDWSMIEDQSEKVCAGCSKFTHRVSSRRSRMPPRLVIPPTVKTPEPFTPSPMSEHSADANAAPPLGPYDPHHELNAHTVGYIDSKLNAWLEKNPDRDGGPAGDEEMGKLMAAMNGLDFDPGMGGCSFSTSSSTRDNRLKAPSDRIVNASLGQFYGQDRGMLDELTRQPQGGFERQKVTGSKDWTRGEKQQGLIALRWLLWRRLLRRLAEDMLW
ncbi:hypothetical protein GE09DRAFT_1244203 [Coniochaeta sp. 2T2.1]|nr:hypothetical protein GE09DRAFT_1244203 [Coniochaeta sp. 2T2.1]